MVAQAIIADGPRRPWTITLGLVEGYIDGEGETHSISHVIRLHHQWQRERDAVLGCTITPTTISYAYLLEGHLIGSTEPGVIVAGDINVLYQADVWNDEASGHVLSLALYLG